MDNLLPNFLFIGAARTGTTSLFYYLNQHSDVFIPVIKEGRFFSQMPGDFQGPGSDYQNDTIVSIEDYKELYREGRHVAARGDISNDYLFYYKKSIENIKKYLDRDVKIIIVLRSPIDRAYSNYQQHIQEGWEKLSFEEALEAEDQRKKSGWAWPFLYKEVGLYYESVKAYISNFTNIKIFLFEDLFQFDNMANELCEFIGVQADFKFDTKIKYNLSGTPKSKLLNKFLTPPTVLKPFILPILKLLAPGEKWKQLLANMKSKNLRKIPMKPGTREYLKTYFQNDIEKLQYLVNRDILFWLR